MDSVEVNSNFKTFLEEVGSYYGIVDEQEVQIIRKKQDQCYENFMDAQHDYAKCLNKIDDKYDSLSRNFKFKTEKAAKNYKQCISLRKLSECHERTWVDMHNNMKQYLTLLKRIDTISITH